jgi:VanZ family protein
MPVLPLASGWQRCVRLSFGFTIAALVALTLAPIGYLKPLQAVTFWDKAEHALAFGGLALQGLLAYPRRPLVLLLLLLLLGGVIELIQAATGWRSGEWADWLADAIGLFSGLALIVLVQRGLLRA